MDDALAAARRDLARLKVEMREFAETVKSDAAEMLRARDRWMTEGLARLEDFANR